MCCFSWQNTYQLEGWPCILQCCLQMIKVIALYFHCKCLIPSWHWKSVALRTLPTKRLFPHRKTCETWIFCTDSEKCFFLKKASNATNPSIGNIAEKKKKSFLLMNIDKFYSQVWFQARKDKSPFHEALKNWKRNTKFTNSFQCSSLFYHHYWKSTGPETFLAWKPIRWHFKIQTWEAISDFIPFFSLIATLSFHCGSQPIAFQPTLQPPTCLFMHTKEHSHVRLLTSHSFLHPGHDWLHIFTSPTQDMQWTLPWASQHSWSPLQILPHICKAMMKWVSVPSHTQTTSSQS